MKNKSLVFAGALTLILSSCNTQLGSKAGQLLSPLTNIGVKQTLDSEVADLQKMRQELEASWGATQGRIASVEKDVAAFGTEDTRLSKEELRQVGTHVLDTDTAEIMEAGSAEGEVSEAMEGVAGVSEEAREEASKMGAEGKRILKELKTGIPSEVTGLTREVAAVATKAAAIRYRAENLRGVAEKNVLMTKEDMAQFEQNTAKIDQEINALAELADIISREGGALSERLSSTTTRFQGKLNSYGGK